jgi:hypothetical protein
MSTVGETLSGKLWGSGMKELDHARIAPCFERYSRVDLAARHLFFVARKR